MSQRPHPEQDGPEPDKLVFFHGGSYVECTSDQLHPFTARDDYAFALDMEGLPDEVIRLCGDFGLPPRVYGDMIEEAMMRASVAVGTAACITIAAQRFIDGESNVGTSTRDPD